MSTNSLLDSDSSVLSVLSSSDKVPAAENLFPVLTAVVGLLVPGVPGAGVLGRRCLGMFSSMCPG